LLRFRGRITGYRGGILFTEALRPGAAGTRAGFRSILTLFRGRNEAAEGGKRLMKTNRSVGEILASLESQAGFHRERAAFHAGHEEHHKAQRSAHESELAEIERRLEAFRAAASEALELADRPAVAVPQPDVKQKDLGSASRPKLGRMVTLLLQDKGVSERFGPAGLTREVNERFGERLRRPVTVPQISIVLRRLQNQGKIHQVRQGRPHWEALYAKEEPGGVASRA
jgi:hypothetical protein